MQNARALNFAPVEPLKNARRIVRSSANDPSSLNAFLREIGQEILSVHDTEFQQLAEQARIIANLRAGKLIMKQDLFNGGYVFFSPNSASADRFNYPLFPQNSEILKAKWSKSRPAVAARSFGDGYKSEIQRTSVDLLIKNYFRDIFTHEYELREALSAQDYGTYITHFFYNSRLNQMRETIPIIQNTPQTVLEGYGACFNCGHENTPDAFARGVYQDENVQSIMPQCPECGGYNVSNLVQPTVVDQAEVVGVEEIIQGDITGRLLDVAAARWDPHVLAHDSDYFTYAEYVPLRLVHQMFGENIGIEGGDGSDMGLQIVDALAAKGGQSEGFGVNDIYGTQESLPRAEMRTTWLRPSRYAGVRLSQDEETFAGIIPADTPLEQIFPDGLCFVSFNDFNLIPVIAAEKANIRAGVMFIQSHSGIGKGVGDAADIAKDLSELYSMAMASVKRYGAGGLIINESLGLTQADVRKMFQPRQAVFTKQPVENVSRGVFQMQTNPVNPALPEFLVQCSNLLNMAFMTGDFTQGMVQDVDINTLGGQELAHAKAEEQKGAIFTMKAFHREGCASIIFDLFREYIKLPRYYTYENDRHGRTKGKWLQSDQLSPFIRFDAVPESEIAINAFERRAGAREMITAFGGIGQLIQATQIDPKMTAWFTKQFGQDLPSLNEEEIHLVCIDRVDAIKEASAIYQDPEQILQALGTKLPKVREFGHVIKAEFLSAMLDDDELQEWPPYALAALSSLIEMHYELEAESQARNAMLQQDVQNMLGMRQQQMQQEAARPEQEAVAQENDRAMVTEAAMEMAKRGLDEEQRDADDERQTNQKLLDHHLQMERDRAQAKAQERPMKADQRPAKAESNAQERQSSSARKMTMP